jgi:hypothetical protein
VDQTAKLIKKNYYAAHYSFIKIAAECFQRSIFLYKNSFSSTAKPDEFINDFGPIDKNPLKIYFVGSFRYGHF